MSFFVAVVFKPKFHMARHVTTRNLAHAFWHRKKSWRNVSRVSLQH